MSIITQIHDGRIFPSMSAADRALGIYPGTTAYHIDTHGTTENIGKTNNRQITFEGVTYPSITAACKATGLSRDAINWRRGYRKPWQTPASGAK